MNRRNFLQFLGVCAAGAALPISAFGEKIARAPAWAKQVLRFQCAPLRAGHYTFSALAKKAGENLGLYVTGVEATGGETIFEVPGEDALHLTDSRITPNGIRLGASDDGHIDFTRAQIERGSKVGRIA